MANIKSKNLNVNMSIPVITLREGEYFVLYTPAFDLSSYGKTLEVARKNFTETIEIFVDELLENGKLQEELISLGWELDMETKTVSPPVLVEHSLVQIPSLAYAI